MSLQSPTVESTTPGEHITSWGTTTTVSAGSLRRPV
jgi:hypothetical protein